MRDGWPVGYPVFGWMAAPMAWCSLLLGGGHAYCCAVVRPCAGYPACLTLLHLYQRLLVFFYNNRIGLFKGLPMEMQLSSSKFEIKFLFLGASISNLVYLFSSFFFEFDQFLFTYYI